MSNAELCVLKEGTSHALIYLETQWPTLSERREASKLKYFCKMVNGEAPNYLRELVPGLVGEHVQHNLRNIDNIRMPKTRTEIYRKVLYPQPLISGINYN